MQTLKRLPFCSVLVLVKNHIWDFSRVLIFTLGKKFAKLQMTMVRELD